MKTIIMGLCCTLISAINGYSQAYQFNVASGTYSNLSGSTSCNNGLTWDDPNFTIPIGFNFSYFGQSIDTLLLSWGYGGTLLTSVTSNGVASMLSPFGSDLMDRGYVFSAGPGQSGSQSNISYQTSGTNGNRIFKLEWNNAGFYGDIQRRGVNATDFVNFQLWLYETTNQFEIHFGPSLVSNPTDSYDGFSGPDILLIPNFNLTNLSFGSNYYSLSGLPNSPSLLIKSPNQLPSYINGTVSNGTVYRFNPLSTSNGAEFLSNHDQWILYPQPAAELLYIDGPPIDRILIYDKGGRLVLDQEKVNELNLSKLASGVYYARLISDEQMSTKKLLIKR